MGPLVTRNAKWGGARKQTHAVPRKNTATKFTFNKTANADVRREAAPLLLLVGNACPFGGDLLVHQSKACGRAAQFAALQCRRYGRNKSVGAGEGAGARGHTS
jgi:hypothetical protein